MAMLVNRNSSRLECLYYIIQSAYAKYGTETEFKMTDVKYDEEDEHNVHQYCQLLEEGFVKYCPFLENQFDQSKCYATRALNEVDSTKGKNYSDVVRTLEGLGFVRPTQNSKFVITDEGEKWLKSSFGTDEWQEIIDDAIMSYGPFVGFLYKVKMVNQQIVTPSQVYIGYPNTNETVEVETDTGGTINVPLSVGSKPDSVTRTRSKFLSLGLTSGFWVHYKSDNNIEGLPHIHHRDLINKARLTLGKIKITNRVNDKTSNKLYVKHPLSYGNLLKDVKALRENGIKDIRTATMAAANKVINRRFIIVDILNRASQNNTVVSYKKLYDCFVENSDEFFVEVDSNKWAHIFQSELDIAFLAGLPFEINRNQGDLDIVPLTIINEEELRVGVSGELLQLADEIWDKVIN